MQSPPVPHRDTSSSLLPDTRSVSFLRGQLFPEQSIHLVQRIEAMYVNFSGHKFDFEARLEESHEAEHADRVDETAGDKRRSVLDGRLMDTEQNVFSDELPDCGLDLHGLVLHGLILNGSVFSRFWIKPGNRSCPYLLLVWHLE